jgi:hypothetical protein
MESNASPLLHFQEDGHNQIMKWTSERVKHGGNNYFSGVMMLIITLII